MPENGPSQIIRSAKNVLKYITYKNQEIWKFTVEVLQKHLLYATTCCANKCPEVCADILWALLPDIIISNTKQHASNKKYAILSKIQMCSPPQSQQQLIALDRFKHNSRNNHKQSINPISN